jgi:hypothetical protein
VPSLFSVIRLIVGRLHCGSNAVAVQQAQEQVIRLIVGRLHCGPVGLVAHPLGPRAVIRPIVGRPFAAGCDSVRCSSSSASAPQQRAEAIASVFASVRSLISWSIGSGSDRDRRC